MKQGNSISSPSNCNCVNLQLHLLSIPNSLFSDRLRASIMSIIAFIALVASFSLKNLPISEKTFVPLLLGIGLLYFLLVPQSYKKSVTYGNPCALFYTLSILYFELAELELLSFTILIHFSYHQAKLTILRHNQSKKLPYSIYLSILSRTHHGFLHFSSVHHTDKHVCRQPLP